MGIYGPQLKKVNGVSFHATIETTFEIVADVIFVSISNDSYFSNIYSNRPNSICWT